MNIIADENLAYADDFFADFGEIKSLAGRSIGAKDVQNADALLVRSVTPVNAQLLAQSPVQFVGSATIGTDHLDINYLNQQHIAWANAAGCNAQAVAEYVVTALLTLRPQLLSAEREFCLGIVGLGNVGTRLAKLAQQFGWRVLGCDPFVQRENIPQVELKQLLQQSNAVSLHVPLTKTGTHPTYHLLNADTLAYLPKDSILINSARGAVIQESALFADLQKTQRQVVLDVFEFEPLISQQLLDNLALATPHIAGYSLEGKARGTQMIYQAFCQKFGFSADKHFASLLPPCEKIFQQQDFKQILATQLPHLYDIRRDDKNLRACLKNGEICQQDFDLLRKNYPLRREWSAYGA